MSPFFGFGEEPTQTRVQLALFPALELIISLRDLINAQLRYVDIVEAFESSQFRLMAAIGVRPDFIAVNDYRGVSGLAGPVDPRRPIRKSKEKMSK